MIDPELSETEKTMLTALGSERIPAAELVKKVEKENPQLSPDEVRAAFWSLFNLGYVDRDEEDRNVYRRPGNQA